jgi:hypothetical protein
MGARQERDMIAAADFDGMEPEEKACFIIDHYADIFLDNYGLGLSRRRILSIMYEARKRLMRQWRLSELVKVLNFLQETFHQDLEADIGIFKFLLPLPRKEAEDLAVLKAEQHFELGNYRLALIYYQLLEEGSGEWAMSERVQQCLERLED